ncbi:MAG: calcium-binding protein, partial [Alphaproteobacteria bacterium]
MSIFFGPVSGMTPLPPPAGPHLFRPEVAALPGEGFAVAANQPQTTDPDSYANLVVGAVSDRDGAPVGPTFALPAADLAPRYLGDIAASPSGTIAVAWNEVRGPVQRLRLAVLDRTGDRIGDGFAIDVTGAAVAIREVVALSDGTYAVVWNQGDDNVSDAWFQRVSAGGSPIGTPVAVAQEALWFGGAMFRGVAVGDTLAIAGETASGTVLWRFGLDGTPASEPVVLRPGGGGDLVDLDVLANGDLAVTWATGDGSFVGRFDAGGVRVADDVRVLDHGDQSLVVEPLQDGGFVAGSMSYLGDGYAVELRAFDRDGVPTGEATTLAAGALLSFDMADLDDGRVAVVLDRIVANRSTVEIAVASDGASNVPVGGGETATVAHWWEQEAIGRADGIDTLVTADSLALKPFIANLGLAGADDLNADGNAMANLMAGNDGDNILVGYLGNDSLDGGGGDDFLAAGRGDDTGVGGAGDDIVWGGQGRDLALGGAGADTLNGDRHDDVLDGGDGDDVLNGGEGRDLVLGADGRDRLTGGRGADTLSGGG